MTAPSADTNRPYHHGDLRRALLAAARELLAERGLDGLALREVARRAGVSHNAPYNHFKDRGALMAALAVDGLHELRDRCFAAAEAAGPEPRAGLRASGIAYVMFAAEQPQVFGLMFRRELREEGDPSQRAAVRAAGLAAYAVLLGGLRKVGEVADESDGEIAGLAAWALVHGLATLIVEGPVENGATSRTDIERLAGQVLDRFQGREPTGT